MINDDWFSDGFKVYESPVQESYHLIRSDFFIGTSNGPRFCPTGYYLITNAANDKYPLSPESFANLKDDLGDNNCISKKIIKIAKLADHSGTIITLTNERVNYTLDKDYIVYCGPGDYAIINKDIFTQTYTIGE